MGFGVWGVSGGGGEAYGFRVSGLRFRVLGFLGFRVLGFWGFRVLGVKVLGSQVVGFKGLGFREGFSL